MNYKQAIDYIHSTPKFSRVLGNDLLRALLDKRGNPQEGVAFIHIAGTNGKGSCASMLSEVLINSGYKTGLFTSPYIERFNERIRINGKEIADNTLAKITTRLRSIIEANDTPVSEFALDTAIALEHFKKQKCDIVILETGMGGRLDATNVIEKPLLSVIMSIGLDHMQYLGNSIEEITAEKCGIIKDGCPVAVYPKLDKKAEGIIQDFCKKHSAPYLKAQMPKTENESLVCDGNSYDLSLKGTFQYYNAMTVITAVKELRRQGYSIPDSALKYGLENSANPARFERLNCGLILDGAHNLPACQALCETLQTQSKPVCLCIAMMEDKAIGDCIAELARLNPIVVATEIDMPRCAKASAIAKEFARHGITAIIEENPYRGAIRTIELSGKDKTAVACGSLYLAGILRKCLGATKDITPFYTYILRCSDNSLYTGIATDVQRRFKEHLSDPVKGAKYTKNRKPVKIEAVWKAYGRSSASKLEAHIKKLTKAQKEKLIDNPLLLEEEFSPCRYFSTDWKLQ